jgi:hypothetical protein
MDKYRVVVEHEFMVTTGDIISLLDNTEFTNFVGADDVDFIDGKITYEIIEGGN